MRPRALGFPAASDYLAARVKSAAERHRRLPPILHALAMGASNELAAVHGTYHRYFAELALPNHVAPKLMGSLLTGIFEKETKKAMESLRLYAAAIGSVQATK